MNRLVVIGLLSLFVLVALPIQGVGNAQASPEVKVVSQYFVDHYGFAVIEETVIFNNNGTTALSIPDVVIGFGEITSLLVATPVVSDGYNITGSGDSFVVSANGQSVSPGSRGSFSVGATAIGITSTTSNGSLVVKLLTSPSVSIPVGSFVSGITLPAGTLLASPLVGFSTPNAGANETYVRSVTGTTTLSASTVDSAIAAVASSSVATDFHPLHVYSATRTVSVAADGTPVVTDSLTFKNLGTTRLVTLTLSPLIPSGGKVTILPSIEPRLLSPFQTSLTGYSLDLTQAKIGSAVGAGSDFSITYRYPLTSSYFSTSGGVVTVALPNTPPLPAVVDSFSITTSLSPGVRLAQGPSGAFAEAGPWTTGVTKLSYTPTVGWALDDGVPAGSLIFVLVLTALFVSRTTLTEEEETEEESSTERASAMIKAFEEKTTMVNALWSEIAGADPNELDKAHFDEIRSRLDSFRSRALQRLNEVKLKSTTPKFFDLLNQIHTTEREVDRAAKDTLNLYEQYYTRRMRKEVFDRLQPQYMKRLEKALNQLSDELHSVQREAKLL